MKPLGQAGAFTLLSVACLTIMVGCVIVPGLPSIAQNLGVPGAAGWLVTLPALGVVLFGHAAGRFIDRQGAYRSLCLGLVLYGALGAAGMLLHGPVPVFGDRILLGGATALVMAAGTGLISDLYEGRARLAMLARQGMAIELGGVIFLFVGGLLAVRAWQWPFLLYLLAWVFLAMVLTFVPRRDGPTRAVGEAGAEPMPAKLGDVYLAAALSMTAFFTGIILLPLRLHAIGLDEARTGYFLSFVSLVAVTAALLMPRLVRASGARRTLVAGFLGYAAAHTLYALSDSLEAYVLGGALMGAGFGLTIPLVNHMAVERSDARQRGRTLARLSIAIFLGQFLSSFTGFIPGRTAAVFACAAGVALLVAALFGSTGLIREGTHA